MRYLPLFLDVRDRPVLIVGGGAIAERKLNLLRTAGAAVSVVAPRISSGIAALVATGAVRHWPENFRSEHLSGQRLVVAATNDVAVNAAVAAAAEAVGVWVNVVDDPAHSSCIVPAIVDRSPLIVAISSGGTAPMLARRVRARLETLLDESVGKLALLLARWRTRIIDRIPAPDARRSFYDALLDGEVEALLKTQRDAEADAAIGRALASVDTAHLPRGTVMLVGAGPGDPGLLTLNALRALQRADVILHDRLVSPEVLALARRDAQLISVGKEAGRPSASQDDIHRLLVEHARAHRYVVRLKGGDPLLFGRGGEEMERLHREGIAYEVVPGITAAVAAGAYAGIPLTGREHAHGVRFLTAHPGEGQDAPDWRSWARTSDTLAIYMGLAQCAVVRHELLRHGRDGATPVALIENATRPGQRVILGRLDELHRLPVAHALKSPTLLIVGSVAGLANELHWFGQPPVAGDATIAERVA